MWAVTKYMKKPALPKPVTILILTLLTVILWVGLSIYRTFTIKPTPQVPEEISKPLTPVLNTNTIQKIESSLYIPDSEVPRLDAVGTPSMIQPTESPIPTATPEATSSASSNQEI